MLIRHATSAITSIRGAARVAVLGLGALTWLAGCGGEVVADPAVEVSRLRLSANTDGALALDECVKLKGAQACASYPNPKACDGLLVSIREDGSTIGQCSVKGVVHVLRSIAEGLPITCKLDPALGCVRCVDLYGGFALGNCGESCSDSGSRG